MLPEKRLTLQNARRIAFKSHASVKQRIHYAVGFPLLLFADFDSTKYLTMKTNCILSTDC